MGTAFFFLFIAVIAIMAVFASLRKGRKTSYSSVERQMRELARGIAHDFEIVGWGSWGTPIHIMPDQITRMKRSADSNNMVLVSHNHESCEAVVRGERGIEYQITSLGCSCPDFAKRRLPCKYMYFVVCTITDN